MKYKNAQQAFEDLYTSINDNGILVDNTKVFYNKGFYILNPLDNKINTDFRKWNLKYANREWEWYLSGNPSAKEISKFAPIWENHMDEKGNVRSNYGWQWNRKNSLSKVIHASVSAMLLYESSFPLSCIASVSPILEGIASL